jgi:hypothetical protein
MASGTRRTSNHWSTTLCWEICPPPSPSTHTINFASVRQPSCLHNTLAWGRTCVLRTKLSVEPASLKCKEKLNLHHEGIWAMEVSLHAFLTSALDGGEWSASRHYRFTPGGTAPEPAWTLWSREKSLAPTGNRTPTVPSLYRLRYPCDVRVVGRGNCEPFSWQNGLT